MENPVSTSIFDVTQTLNDLYKGSGANKYLSGTSVLKTTGRLKRIAVTGPSVDQRFTEIVQIVSKLVRADLVSRRTEKGGRQNSKLSLALLNLWSCLANNDSGRLLSKQAVIALAQAVSTGAYTLAADELAFERHREDDLALSAHTKQILGLARRRYLTLLKQTRTATREGDRQQIQRTLERVVKFTQGRLVFLAQRIGMAASPTSEDPAVLEAEIVVSALIKRCAMLVSACILLDYRLARTRARNAAMKIAAHRQTLIRSLPNMRNARENLTGVSDRQIIDVVTRIDDLQYIKRGRKPYGTASASFTSPFADVSIRVPYKTLWQSGVSAGPLWLRGRYKQAETMVEMQFEGPGSHAGTVWEDWLAVLTRKTFHLYPGHLHMENAVPQLRTRGSGLDILNR